MYLETLFDIKDDIPDITSKNISHIDNFLGSIGKSNLFYKKDFLITITQKSLSEQILYWLCEKNIIDEKTVICHQYIGLWRSGAGAAQSAGRSGPGAISDFLVCSDRSGRTHPRAPGLR